jgi:hypothetical protein
MYGVSYMGNLQDVSRIKEKYIKKLSGNSVTYLSIKIFES